ncbi:hypothetical protein JMJ35_001733 [Cladonia borealis]|uniref:Uncharacterized protein n=1 Tax=Cladonia borealis TaxID=184061 RepID=A0AA39V761_9LECA|nr:hypothetical protein JMJ35_001733 [Cladonia borealis]
MCKFAESSPLVLQTWMTQFAVTKEIRMASDAGDPGKVVLENENKRRSINLENFSVSSSTETDANGLPSWNLAVFRYPEHPNVTKVKPVKGTKYLVLQFPTVQVKAAFVEAFDELVETRDSDLKSYQWESSRKKLQKA